MVLFFASISISTCASFVASHHVESLWNDLHQDKKIFNSSYIVAYVSKSKSEMQAQPAAISLNNLEMLLETNPIYVSCLCQFTNSLLFLQLDAGKVEQYFILRSIKHQNQFTCSIYLTDRKEYSLTFFGCRIVILDNMEIYFDSFLFFELPLPNYSLFERKIWVDKSCSWLICAYFLLKCFLVIEYCNAVWSWM